MSEQSQWDGPTPSSNGLGPDVLLVEGLYAGYGRKQPFHFALWDGGPFAFAGIWESWLGVGWNPLAPFAILTTEPNELVRPAHDRMPVILPPEHYAQWLDPGFSNVAELSKLLKPYDAARMRKFAVSTRVNSVTNEDEGVCEPVAGGGEDPQMSMWG